MRDQLFSHCYPQAIESLSDASRFESFSQDSSLKAFTYKNTIYFEHYLDGKVTKKRLISGNMSGLKQVESISLFDGNTFLAVLHNNLDGTKSIFINESEVISLQ